jgi:hypothetical protein
MDTQILPASEAEGLPRGALHGPKGHESPITSCKLFRFTHFRKNASATPLVSHTFKTKDLKPFRFIHFQKSGGSPLPLDADLGSRALYASPDSIGTNHKSLRLSPLTSALTSKRAAKSFRCNTYEKHTGGEGGTCARQAYFRLSTVDRQLTTHQSLVTSHATEVS